MYIYISICISISLFHLPTLYLSKLEFNIPPSNVCVCLYVGFKNIFPS